MGSTGLGADARTLAVGARLGRYVIGHRVGRGGMAEIYLGSAVGLGEFEKPVAIKLVLPHLKDEPDFIRMFMEEAQLAARLDHPNIVTVFDLGYTDGEYYLAMEFVHGVDLRGVIRDVVRRTGHLALPRPLSVAILIQVCDALHHAHEATGQHGEPLGIVHRDVSPGNILVRFDGVAKLTDFGIAKAVTATNTTRTGIIKGKPGYMSPEQCLARPMDRRSDVFNLGIVLYELTVGRRLFYADSDFSVLNQIISGDVPRPTELDPGYPADLEEIVLKALTVRPDQRFATAAELGLCLRQHLSERGHVVGPQHVGAWMREQYGNPPPPTPPRAGSPLPGHAATPEVVSGLTAPAFANTRPMRLGNRGATVGAFLGGCVLVGGIVWAGSGEPPRGEGSQPPPDATAPRATGPAVLPDSAKAEPPEPEVAVRMPAPAAEEQVLIVSDDPLPVDEASEPGAAEASDAGAKKRRGTKRDRRPAASSDTKTPAEPWRKVLPPSMRTD